MRRLVLPWIAGAFLATTLSMSNIAWADATTDADALISRGLELREKGKDDEALGLFRQAQQKAPSPRARAQVALAEQALGMWVVAETDLGAAIGDGTDPWISKNRSALDRALATIRGRISSLEVRGAEKADVFIDGQKVGSGIGPYRVEAGKRTLEVRASGYQTTSRSVDLPAGGTARESVHLIAAPVAASPSTTPVESGPKRVDDPGRGQRLLGWVFVGAGVALAATGGASLLVRSSKIDDYNNDKTCPGIGVQQPSQACQDKADAPSTWLTVAIITLIAGGASAIGGGVIIGTAPKSAPASSGGLRFMCGPAGCAGTF